MNLVLIGYRCTGKSTVGCGLAARLKMRFVDTDDLIEERQGASITEIVKSHGWEYFRVLENQVIAEISTDDDLVIAVGGGAVLDPQNVMAMKKNGLLIWLKADSKTLFKRMGKDSRTFSQRPTLTGQGTLEEIEEVIAYREPFYQRASEVCLDTSALDVEAVAEKIVAILSHPQTTTSEAV